VLVRVSEHGDDGVTLRLDDIDDDDPVRPAVALLPGGPPWLVEPERDEEDEAGADEAADAGGTAAETDVRSVHGPDADERGGRALTPLELAVAAETRALDAQVRAFRARVRELEAQVVRLDAKVRNQKTALRKEKVRQRSTALRSGAAANGVGSERTPSADVVTFPDPREQFRHEVYLAWAERIPAGQKAERPLGPYTLGPEFLASIEEVEGVDRPKVVQVVVEILTGLAEKLAGRDLHPLRTTAGGGSAPLTRDGGWSAWRVALQRESPAARRLHFWRRGIEVELARVVLHDDLRM
jgi:hypothetical protein